MFPIVQWFAGQGFYTQWHIAANGIVNDVKDDNVSLNVRIEQGTGTLNVILNVTTKRKLETFIA